MKTKIFHLRVLLFPAILLVCALSNAFAQSRVTNSLLLLIDSSGSMGSTVGDGSGDIKIDAAKKAAQIAVKNATEHRLTEVAILAFEGGCGNPVPRYLDFTADPNELYRFVRALAPGGGTPMAEAVLFSNDFMQNRRNPKTAAQMIVLLADGQNDCGDIPAAMSQLQASGIAFRHETVGFGIQPNSQAADDLRAIATATGGVYHHAASANQLADVFAEFVQTITLLEMLGKFQPKSKSATTTITTTPAQKSAPQGPILQKNLWDRFKVK